MVITVVTDHPDFREAMRPLEAGIHSVFPPLVELSLEQNATCQGREHYWNIVHLFYCRGKLSHHTVSLLHFHHGVGV